MTEKLADSLSHITRDANLVQIRCEGVRGNWIQIVVFYPFIINPITLPGRDNINDWCSFEWTPINAYAYDVLIEDMSCN